MAGAPEVLDIRTVPIYSTDGGTGVTGILIIKTIRR